MVKAVKLLKIVCKARKDFLEMMTEIERKGEEKLSPGMINDF